MVNSGTLCFAGRPVLDALSDFLKPQKAEAYTPPKTPKADKVIMVVNVKEKQLQRLQRIAERTRKQRIRQKLGRRISRMEQCS
ncbi:hypothetical protein [Aneurinibacillus aneurinilyticus]|uniref:hypothetical protein n=1 Tax=Aneurinibacillus aneurinilyticus TaxID=1391 RepID=UPI0023F59548|nr:hypothetical protein [Aneurinibacillus aneurinilyticus]